MSLSISRNSDDSFSVFIRGPLRPIIVDASDPLTAMKFANEDLSEQEREEYFYQESMTAMCDMQQWDRPEDLG